MKKITLFLIVCIGILSVININAQKAGKGEYQPLVLKLDGKQDDTVQFKFDENYIRIEEIAWYVNAQGDVLKDRMVSGTVKVQIGSESYESALPMYDLKGGTRTAPLFNRTVLYNRVYPGGDVKMTIFMGGIKKNTALGDLLTNLAKTAVDIGVGKVGTITSIGTNPALAAASQTLSGSIQGLLKTGESQYGIFQQNNGLEYTFKTDLSGSENFLLAYRGDPLIESQVKIVSVGNTGYEVTVNDTPLAQGAWVLFRITRMDAYNDVRPWTDKARKIKTALDELMDNWRVSAITKAEVVKSLTATTTSNSTADKLLAIRSEINADLALTASERTKWAGELVSLLLIAQEAAQEANATAGVTKYKQNKAALQLAMKNGTPLQNDKVKNAFNEEFKLARQEDETAFVQNFKMTFADTKPTLKAKFTSLMSISGITVLSKDKEFKKLSSQRQKEIEKVAQFQLPPIPNEAELWKRFGKITVANEANKELMETP